MAVDIKLTNPATQLSRDGEFVVITCEPHFWATGFSMTTELSVTLQSVTITQKDPNSCILTIDQREHDGVRFLIPATAAWVRAQLSGRWPGASPTVPVVSVSDQAEALWKGTDPDAIMRFIDRTGSVIRAGGRARLASRAGDLWSTSSATRAITAYRTAIALFESVADQSPAGAIKWIAELQTKIMKLSAVLTVEAPLNTPAR